MNNSAMRVEWDTKIPKQVEEAKTHYRNARKEGRRINDLSGLPIEHFEPHLEGFVIDETELKDGEFAMRIFDDTGDRRIIWNSLKPNEVRDAVTLFDEYLAKGWKAYAIDRNGDRGQRVMGFDPEAQEIIFDDVLAKDKLQKFTGKFQNMVIKNTNVDFAAAFKGTEAVKTAKQKLSDFVTSFKEVRMVPRTYPG